MDQTKALELIVECFGGIAAGSILISVAALIYLQKKTTDQRNARLAKEATTIGQQVFH